MEQNLALTTHNFATPMIKVKDDLHENGWVLINRSDFNSMIHTEYTSPPGTSK